jgi:parallel beta-helix repeat protein
MKKYSTLAFLLVVALTIPITVFTLQQQQDNRSKASTRANVDVAVGGSINSAIQSGGTVNVAAGTYNETLNISASDVTVQATGGRVITNGTMKISGKNVKLIGFTVKGSGSFGAQVDGADGLLLKDFEIDGSQDGGVIVSGSKNVVIDGCNIHGTNAKGTSADGEALSITGGSTNFEVKNCQVHENGEEGIDAKYNGAGDVNGTIHDNMVFGNRGPNIYVDGSSGIKIYNNTSHGTTEGSKAGIMIAAETSYGGSENPKKAGNIDIFNNVIYGNAGGGITFWVESGGSLSDIRVYNNTVDESKPLNVDASPGGTNPVFNNIFTSSPNGGGIQLGNNLTANPGFAGNGDYHLTAGSAAIDKGTAAGAPAFDKDNKARPAGAGVDMGAYEFGATGGTTPSTAPQPTNITPTLYCLGGVPCDAPTPSTASTNPSGNPSGGASQTPISGTNPSGNPSPVPSVAPCATGETSVATNRGRKHHHKHRRGGGGFLEQFFKWLIQLIQQFLGGGGSIPGFPNPGTPCPSPSAAPSTAPSVIPSTVPSTTP